MTYEWDEEKNRFNQDKHGISFEIAALAFEDERCLVLLDRTDEAGEQRWQRLEPCLEDTDGEEITRIISARRAERHEVRRYQEQDLE